MDGVNGTDNAEPKLMVVPPESVIGPTHGIQAFMRSGIDRKSNIIKVNELSDYIANNEERIKQEWRSVPNCKFYKCSVARRPENVLNRNRYYFSEAYDHSRVVLKVISDEEDDGNDYIAANHVDSYLLRDRFIAAQAPLPQTITDHWRMIWDYRCSQIVTLTKLLENGFYKADKYWPHEHSVKYGNISVSHKKTSCHKDFEVLTYEVENSADDCGKREIEHYFYHSWPDREPTVTFDSLLDLIETMKTSKLQTDDTRIVVQCSAGVGRTGSFILINNMIEMGEQCGYVDFYKYFVKLRCQRAYAVDGPQQYLCIYKCVEKYFSQK